MSRASAKGSVRRFESATIEVSRSSGLRANHPALSEARTIFTNSVVGTLESPRFLVSGVNNPKLGGKITKGDRTGWPIYQLTLEERATCPRSCAQWSTCYGNAMPYARRHGVDEHFIDALRSEILTVSRQHPEGLLVRLHTLGDFFSVEYVLMWGEMLARLPQLHVFGYTARCETDADPKSRQIAQAIRLLTQGAWNRFAIRSSQAKPGRQVAIVTDLTDPDMPGVIVCPAQMHATEACATCGLCWAEGARGKTIAFLRHGMKSNKGPRPTTLAPSVPPVIRPAPAGPPPVLSKAVNFRNAGVSDGQMDRAVAFLMSKSSEDGLVRGLSLGAIAVGAQMPQGSVIFILRRLAARGRIEIIDAGPHTPKIYRVGAVEGRFFKAPEPQAIKAHPVKATSKPDADAVFAEAFKRTASVTRAPAPQPTPPIVPTPEHKAPHSHRIEPDVEPGAPPTLMNLRAGQCRWPIGDFTGVDQLYCAKRTYGAGSYCTEHHAVMHAKPVKRAAHLLSPADHARRAQTMRDQRNP